MYLRDLMTRVEAVPELPESPSDPVGENDHVVGVLPEDLQRLFAVRHQIGRQFDLHGAKTLHAQADLIGEKSSDEIRARIKQLNDETIRLASEKSLVDIVFWASVRLAFPELLDKEEVSVHEGWQVCWTERMPLSLLEHILRM